MEKKVLKGVKFCDKCGTDDSVYHRCVRCGKDFCFNCAEKEGTDYPAGVHHSGSGDCFFCHDCESAAAGPSVDPYRELLAAYKAMVALRKENQDYYAEWEKRVSAAEVRARSLFGKLVHRQRFRGSSLPEDSATT